MKSYKHLFFDLDNTLWDFRANAHEAFYDIFKELGLFTKVPDFRKFLSSYELYNEHLWTEYRRGKVKKEHLRTERMILTFREMGVDDIELAHKVGEMYLLIAPQKTNLFDGVHETLGYLSGKYNLYILTNGFSEVQIKKVNNSGLQPYFRKLFMAEMVGFQKPDRRFFEYAIKSLHAHKHECLMIGDDLQADIMGARNAGIDQVFFNPSNKQTAIEPTWEIGSIAALTEFL